MSLPPWTYRIFDPDEKTATVCVRLLASDLPSKGSGRESVEALVELRGLGDRSEQTIQRDALKRLQSLVQAEIDRLS